MKKTLLIGATENPERYAYKAINALVKHGHPLSALGIKAGVVSGVEFITEKEQLDGIDTVTLYLGAKNQREYYYYVIGLKPKRVLFNPGTENPEFEEKLINSKIEVEHACTLVLLSTGQY